MPSTPHANSEIGDDDLLAQSRHKPLPADYFGHVQISDMKRKEYRDIVTRRVNALLADEIHTTEAEHETEWKTFRRIDDLSIYRRRLRGRQKKMAAAYEEFPEAALAVERGNASMKVLGTARGTIEDMLYGISATTRAEMLTGVSYSTPIQDANLLSVVDKATKENPLQSLDIIWLLIKTPVLHARDFCYIKATGTGIDAQGRAYGYLVAHSVDLPECPPFDYRQTKMLRAKVFYSFLFRQRSPDCMEVIGRGLFDLDGGELLKLLLPHFVAIVLKVLLRGGTCGEAKKLTLLALQNAEERSQTKALTKKSVCSMCVRRNQRMFSGARLRSCDGCGVPVCMDCNLKDKRIFLGTKRPHRSAVCCMTCAQHLKSIQGVRLGAPEFLVEAEYFRKLEARSCPSSVAMASPSSLSSDSSSSMARGDNSETFNSTTSLSSDLELPTAPVAMTNSTSGDSRAASNVHENSSSERCDGNGPLLSVDLIELDAEAGRGTKVTGTSTWIDTSNRVSTLSPSHQVTALGGSARILPTVRTPPYKQRPNSLLEWMKELQSSADEAYSTTKANEEAMKKAMR